MSYNNETEKLNELRKKLENLIDDHYSLTHPEVIELSKQLDALIFEFQANSKSSIQKTR